MEERYTACFLLHALGDTIGFKNGEWEFNYFAGRINIQDTLELLYEFIELGGINHLSIKGWKVSDDTVMHLAIAKSLLRSYKNMDELGNIMKKEFIKASNNFTDRYPGITLDKSIDDLKKGQEWNKMKYNLMAGGSGASMRSLCIGLAYHGEKNRDALIEIAIDSSRITHNSTIGYLGGLVSALFTAYAIEGVHVYEWPFKLLKLLKSGKIVSFISSTGRGINDYSNHYDIFVNKWKTYVDDKFVDGKPIKRKSSRNLVYRGKYYYNTFGFKKSEDTPPIGSGGDDSVIIAYDCLIDSLNNWEKLVIYAMLHIGDTDTTGCIAGGWYGALYGFEDIPKQMLEDLEYSKKIKQYGIDFHKKFYK